MRQRKCRPRAAFTLIEMIAVVMLLALLASAVAWSFSGSLAKSALVETIEQVRSADASARELARRTGRPARLVFDLDGQRLIRRSGVRDVGMNDAGLDVHARMVELRTPGGTHDSGKVTIDLGPAGASMSYAVRIRSGQQERWVFVAGLSGESSVSDDEKAATRAFSAIARRDAD